MRRLFVDVDDTLVIYENLGRDFNAYGVLEGEKWRINVPLYNSIIRFLDEHPKELVVIWSGGGGWYAEKVSKQIFSETAIEKLTFMDKFGKNFALVRKGDIVVDDMAATLDVRVSGASVLGPDEAPKMIDDYLDSIQDEENRV